MVMVVFIQYQHPATCTISCESLEMKCCYSGKPSDLTQKQVLITALYKTYRNFLQQIADDSLQKCHTRSEALF